MLGKGYQRQGSAACMTLALLGARDVPARMVAVFAPGLTTVAPSSSNWVDQASASIIAVMIGAASPGSLNAGETAVIQYGSGKTWALPPSLTTWK